MIKEGGFLFCASAASPVNVVPLSTLRRVCLRVYMWRLLQELREPLHRRSAMAPLWVKAMQARYWVNTGRVKHKGTVVRDSRENVLLGFFVPGNQREVIEAYDRIRREAGDFSVDELGGLN